MLSRVTLSSAQPTEAAALTAIAFAAKRHWGYAETWIAQWTRALTIDAAVLATQPTFVARLAEAPVGFYSLRLEREVASLDHLWVLPEHMRRGIGRALFAHAEQHARSADCVRLRVESDPHAEPFYLRMGAIRIGEVAADLDRQTRVLPLLEKTLR